jgi:hypothetical protein
MAVTDPIAPLIAWYANDTLPEDERIRVEAHLEECPACRALLEQARSQSELARQSPLEDHLEHVHPSLLVAVERALSTAEPIRRDRGNLLESIWRALAATVLRPAPALAYLLLLIALPAVWIGLGRDGDGAPALTPTVITLRSERALRSEPGAPMPEPQAVPGGATAVLLRLATDLRPEDLRDEALSFTVEIARDGRLEWSMPQARGDLAIENGRAVVSLLVDPSRLGAGAHEVVLRVHKPDDPMDGQALFRRRLRIE